MKLGRMLLGEESSCDPRGISLYRCSFSRFLLVLFLIHRVCSRDGTNDAENYEPGVNDLVSHDV